MSYTFYYRIPKIENFTEEAIPAIEEDLDRRNPLKLIEFIKKYDIQNLTPDVKFSEEELSGKYDRHHSLLMTFMLAILDRPTDAVPVSKDWLHELVLQTENREVSYLSDEEQDKLYELLLQIHPDWGNLSSAGTEPFDFTGYLSKNDVNHLLELLKNIEFQEDLYRHGAKELMEYLEKAASQNREIVYECQL